MYLKNFYLRKIKFNDNLSSFDCGNSSINTFLHSQAYCYDVLKQTSTKLVYSEKKLAGYYTLTLTQIKPEDYSQGYGAIELKYIAISSEYQNKGIGSTILEYIVNKCDKYSSEFGYRYLVLNALISKRKWYEDKGFICLDPNTGDITTLMYFDFAKKDEIDKLLIC